MLFCNIVLITSSLILRQKLIEEKSNLKNKNKGFTKMRTIE